MINDNQPLVSVVIPTYNHARFLERALLALVQQQYTHWEAIIVDNHSQDATDEVVRSFTDPRIRLHKIHNKGIIAASRNMGIANAQGEWVAFLDSDDWWTPDKLTLCLQRINEQVHFIYHDLYVVGEKKSFFRNGNKRTRQLHKPVFTDLLLHGNQISNSSVLVRTSFLEKVGRLNENPKMIGAEDFNSWLKIAKLTDGFIYVPFFLGYYEYHESGVSRKNMAECYGEAIAEFLDGISPEKQKIISGHIAYMQARYHFSHNRFLEALHAACSGFRTGDFAIKLKSVYVILVSLLKMPSEKPI